MAKYLDKDPYTYQIEKDNFIQNLQQFHRSRGTIFRRIPVIRGKQVDLYLLYTKVTAQGGWEKVNDEQKWDEISEFCNIPKICTNAAQALKQIYVRYLYLYERVYHFGEDANQKDAEDRENMPAHKRKNAPIAAVPLTYNYNQHDVPVSLRRNVGMSTDFVQQGEFDKMERALLSGLPNEVDFVVNVCTLLSNEGKHVMQLDKSPRLLHLLMAHVGIFNHDESTYAELYKNWQALTKHNFLKFWYDSVEDNELRELISPKLKDKPPDREAVGTGVLHLGQDQGIRDREGQRIHQLGAIIRNLSFEEENQLPLANSSTVYRFLMLCANSCYSSLRQLALDTLGNLAFQMVLDPINYKSTQLMLKLISQCILSSDKFHIVRGMEILSKLSQNEDNEDLLTENLQEVLYERIVAMLTVQDIQMIVYTLEVLYQLSEMGEVPSTHIAQIRASIDVLVNLVTVEAQSYGPNSLIGIKVVEHTPVSSLTSSSSSQSAQQQQPKGLPRAVTATPPPQHRNLKHGPTDMDGETFASNWLQNHYEVASEGSTSQINMFTEYIASCKKMNISNVLSFAPFINSIRLVYPKVEVKRHEVADGASEIHYVGLRKRAVPLPIPHLDRTVSTPPSKLQRSSMATPSPPSKKKRSGGTSPRPSTPNQLRKTSSLIHQHLATPPQSLRAQPQTVHTSQSFPSPTYPNIQQALLGSSRDNSPSPQSLSPQQLPSPSQLTSFAMRHNRPTTDTNLIKTLLKVKVNQSMSKAAKQNASSSTATASPMTTTSMDTKQEMQATASTTLPTPAAAASPSSTVMKTMEPLSPAMQSRQDDSGLNPQGYAEFAQQQMYMQMAKAQKFIESTTDGPIQSEQTSPGKVKKGRRSSSGSCSSQPSRSPRPSSPRSKSPRANSPKGAAASRSPSAQRAMSPRQLEVCGQVERAQDVVTATGRAHEARIEKVYNKCATKVQMAQAKVDNIENCRNMSGAVEATIERVANASAGSEHTLNQVTTCASSMPDAVISAFSTAVNSGTMCHNFDSSSNQSIETSSVNVNQSYPSLPQMNVNNSLPSHTSLQHTCSNNEPSSSSHSDSVMNGPSQNAIRHSENLTASSSGSLNMNGSVTHLGTSDCISEDLSKQIIRPPPPPSENGKDGSTQQEVNSVNLNGLAEGDLMLEGKASIADVLESKIDQMIVNGVTKHLGSGDFLTKQVEATINSINACDQQRTNLTHDFVIKGHAKAGDILQPLNAKPILGETHSVSSEKTVLQNGYGSPETELPPTMPKPVQPLMFKPGDQSKIDVSPCDISQKYQCSDEDGLNYCCDVDESKNNVETSSVISSTTKNGQHYPAAEPLSHSLTQNNFSNVNGKLEPSSLAIGETKSGMNSKHSGSREGGVSGDGAAPLCAFGEEDVIAQHDGVSDSHDDDSSASSQQQQQHLHSNHDTQPPPPAAAESSSVSVAAASHHTGSSTFSSSASSSLCTSLSTSEHTVAAPVLGHTNHSQHQTVTESITTHATSSSGQQSGDVRPDTDQSTVTLPPSSSSAVQPHLLPQLPSYTPAPVALSGILPPGTVLGTSSLQTQSSSLPPGPVQTGTTALPSVVLVASTLPAGTIITSTILPGTANVMPGASTMMPSTVTVTNAVPACSSVPAGAGGTLQVRAALTPGTTAASTLPLTLKIPPQDKLTSTPAAPLSCPPQVIIPAGQKLTPPLTPSPQGSTGSSSGGCKPITSVIREQLLAGTKRPQAAADGTDKPTKKKSKKSSRTGSVESRRSSSQSSLGAGENMCEWVGCKKCFDNPTQVHGHATLVHVVKNGGHQACRWEGCDGLPRAPWSLVQHIQDRHCTEAALKAAALRRHQVSQMSTPPPPTETPVVPPPVYPTDAAVQAIRRFASTQPFQEFAEMKEGPVTKHIRLTSSLILRNLARYSTLGRSMIKRHENHLAYVALSNVESSTAISSCLWEILQHHCH